MRGAIAATHLILYVRDQGASAAFYRRVLGAEPLLDVPEMTAFALSGRAVLGLMPETGIARLLLRRELLPTDHAALRAELYLIVEDLVGFHARALAAEAKELSPPSPRDWGAEVAYSLDPDGYVLAFAREP